MGIGSLTLSNQFSQVITDRRWFLSTPVSKKRRTELVKEEFVEVEEGSHRKILRRWRNQIEEPLQHEVFRGWIDIRLAGVIPPCREVKKMLTREEILSENEVGEFISLLRASFYINRMLVETDVKYGRVDVTESDHPLIAFFKLNSDDVLKSIRYNIDAIFPSKREALRRFVDLHQEELMTIKVVRKFKIYKAD